MGSLVLAVLGIGMSTRTVRHPRLPVDRDGSQVLTAEYGMTSPITSRDDLPFTTRTATGDFTPWHPESHSNATEAGMQYGLDAVDAIAQLADVDEYEAHTAIVQALLSPDFSCEGAQERGFADGLARLVMIGLRAQAHADAMPFDTRFDPQHAHWCSLNTRADLMEMQLKEAKMTPWRTYAEAGKA